jgi:hypothetical protein
MRVRENDVGSSGMDRSVQAVFRNVGFGRLIDAASACMRAREGWAVVVVVPARRAGSTRGRQAGGRD